MKVEPTTDGARGPTSVEEKELIEEALAISAQVRWAADSDSDLRLNSRIANVLIESLIARVHLLEHMSSCDPWAGLPHRAPYNTVKAPAIDQ